MSHSLVSCVLCLVSLRSGTFLGGFCQKRAMPSSVVAAMRYDAASRVLRIVYVSGNVYDYKDVPPEVYEAMKAASSKGTFLNREIKGRYGYEKVEG